MYSGCGEGANILKRIQNEGNEVCLFVKDPIYKDVWTNLLPKTDKPDAFIDANTVIIFDCSGNGKIADTYRSKGHKVFGASSLMDKLEQDRKFGFEIMQSVGIKTPRTEEFTDFKTGLEYVAQSKSRLVFKPSGTMPCKLTYVSKDNKELIAYMRYVEEKFGKQIRSFILQDFVEGEVVSSEIWCHGNDIVVELFNHTIEVKKCMNDDLGPSTGCAGNATWVDYTEVMQQGICKMIPWVIENNYVGQLDLNAVVNESGVYGLEWTPRMGYDATPTFLSLIETDLADLFNSCASCEVPEVEVSSNYASAVRFTIPPAPVELLDKVDPEDFSASEGIPIQNAGGISESLYLYEVSLIEHQLVHSSGTGVLGLGLAQGKNVASDLDKIYKNLKELHVPDIQYRTDLGTVLPSMIKEFDNVCRKLA
jgi:phosphoribosylamine--glycine ligase